MALYHFNLRQISRNKGQSAIASAAYRSGEKLYSTYYGEPSDYTRKGGVVLAEIHLRNMHRPVILTDRLFGIRWNGRRRIKGRSLHTVSKLLL